MKEQESTPEVIDTTKIAWRQLKQEEVGCCQSIPDPGLIPPTVQLVVNLRTLPGGRAIEVTMNSFHACGIEWTRFVIKISQRPEGGPTSWHVWERSEDIANPESNTELSMSYPFGGALPHAADFVFPTENIDIAIVGSARSTCGIVGHGAYFTQIRTH